MRSNIELSVYCDCTRFAESRKKQTVIGVTRRVARVIQIGVDWWVALGGEQEAMRRLCPLTAETGVAGCFTEVKRSRRNTNRSPSIRL